MCNCSNFVEKDDFMIDVESNMNFDGGRSMDFGSEMEYDNFLTKKARQRRRIKKGLMESGVSKDEAKQLALQQVPRTTLRDILRRLKNGEKVNVIDTPLGQVTLDGNGAVDEIQNALNNATNNTSTNTTSGTNTNYNGNTTNQAGFLKRNGLWIGIGAVVLIGGYFAWKKFGKK